jgi:hypothetical protein
LSPAPPPPFPRRLPLPPALPPAPTRAADIVHVSCYSQADDCQDKQAIWDLCKPKLTAKSFGQVWGCACTIVYVTADQKAMDDMQMCEKKGAGQPIYANKMKSKQLPSVIPKEWETAAKGSAAIKETYARFARVG